MDEERTKPRLTDWEKSPVLWLCKRINVMFLVLNLKAKDVETREHAVHSLRRAGDPYALPPLIKTYKIEKEAVVPGLILWAIEEIAIKNPDHKNVLKALPFFFNLLKTGFRDYQMHSIRALRKIQSPSVIPGLLNILKDKESKGRSAALEVLGKIGDKSIVPDLLEALNDESPGIQTNATDALREIGDESAVPALYKTLKDDNEHVKLGAAYALIKIAKNISENDCSSALKIIKNVTLEIKKFYDEKEDKYSREMIKERRFRFNYFNKVATHIRDNINHLDNKEPLKWKTPKPTTPPNKKIVKRTKAF